MHVYLWVNRLNLKILLVIKPTECNFVPYSVRFCYVLNGCYLYFFLYRRKYKYIYYFVLFTCVKYFRKQCVIKIFITDMVASLINGRTEHLRLTLLVLNCYHSVNTLWFIAVIRLRGIFYASIFLVVNEALKGLSRQASTSNYLSFAYR